MFILQQLQPSELKWFFLPVSVREGSPLFRGVLRLKFGYTRDISRHPEEMFSVQLDIKKSVHTEIHFMATPSH